MSEDRIEIAELVVDCVVGVYPHERRTPQPLIVDLALVGPLRGVALSGRLEGGVDYDRVCDEVKTLLAFRRYRLLEQAAEELAALLLGVHPSLRAVELRLAKPRALAGRARTVAVAITRTRADLALRREFPPWGEVEVLCESPQAGLYLLHLAPGRSIPPHSHALMRELEWPVRGPLERDGAPVAGFSPQIWPRGRIHGYCNPGPGWATIFCCDVPRFVPSDERPAPTEAGRPRRVT